MADQASPQNPLTLSAAALVAGIRRRELLPSAVVQAHIQRIEAVNPAINAVITPKFEAARAEAAAADARLAADDPTTLPPLFGLPVTIKDALPVAGVRFTAGSWFHKEDVAAQDAEVVARIKAAGAIILGKTNCPAFSWITETDNVTFGLTRNPWQLQHSAGGSSGGEAAIIAAGGSPLGIGSDIAGSIRIPAAFCGVAGFKPSPGRIPPRGHVPKAPPAIESWGVVGPLARRVEDLALALDALADSPLPDYKAVALGNLRLLLNPGTKQMHVHPAVAGAVEQAAHHLEAQGMALTRHDDLPINGLLLHYGAIMQRVVGREIRTLMGGGQPLNLRAARRAFMRGEGRVNLKTLHMLQQMQRAQVLNWLGIDWAGRLATVRQQMLGLLGDNGLLISPVFATSAPLHGFSLGRDSTAPFAYPLNALGFPAASIPFGWADGLPLAVQVAGRPGADHEVLAAAAALEAALGGWRLAQPAI